MDEIQDPTQIPNQISPEAVSNVTTEPEAPVTMTQAPVTSDIPLLPAHFTEIDINLIKPNPWQPRKIFKEQELAELSASIKEHGILQPLVVVPDTEGTYQLIVGERRLRASKLAGLTMVPVIIRDAMEERQKLELALIENIQRHNLDPIEEATAYQQLIDSYQLTQDQVSQKVGKNRTTVTNTLRLLNLPLKIQRAIAEEIISEGHGRAILGVTGMERQLALFDEVVAGGFTVRQVEARAREIMQRPKMLKMPKAVAPKDAETEALENELRGKLGTKVKVQKSGETGKIMIEFFTAEELNNFLDKVHRLEN
ncbi:MAG TPA: ParB/RepB/Spo0J family partition protein [Patescibacteria group bacterium]|nr:ParB/RepB/Spo0J family partition protein [Patescibacteria group bacterium]